MQIVTFLEGVIKQDHLSAEFRTTKELLGSSASLGNTLYDSAYTGSVPVLAWIPQTTAAVAVRLLELDASISYIHHDKSEFYEDKELGEFSVSQPPLHLQLSSIFFLYISWLCRREGKIDFPFSAGSDMFYGWMLWYPICILI